MTPARKPNSIVEIGPKNLEVSFKAPSSSSNNKVLILQGKSKYGVSMIDYQFILETGADKFHIQPKLLTSDQIKTLDIPYTFKDYFGTTRETRHYVDLVFGLQPTVGPIHMFTHTFYVSDHFTPSGYTTRNGLPR